MKLQIDAAPQLKAYLMQPYDIAKFQCLVMQKIVVSNDEENSTTMVSTLLVRQTRMPWPRAI